MVTAATPPIVAALDALAADPNLQFAAGAVTVALGIVAIAMSIAEIRRWWQWRDMRRLLRRQRGRL
ncbi:hypothetical protein ASC80_01595 [Afipia sp. Root123D2]|uniref:hypothetical protein n=1 Tax=Afipia sp. Root123D2 TaxID=1736436 RepID=UPI0006F9CDDC|nr:hypothetical protein [Afipia sp. Root123D2]KQW22116.1 hypothetical protein ASC80_01595 [Afipia sp. Root123D2]